MKPLPYLSARVRAAHLFGLWGFAVAQPIYSVLTDEPFWLAVQGYDGVDVVIYGLALLIAPPCVLMALELLAGLLHSKVSRVMHSIFVVVLGSIILFNAGDVLPWDYRAGVAFGLALFFERVYRGWEPARVFLTVCSVAPVLFVAMFLLKVPIAELSTTEASVAAVPEVSSKTPVVLVVFDEFAESSLMTKNGKVDAFRYPNFAGLARSSTWYRNATTVHDYTFWAVPSILTGRLPQNKQLPVVADHPENLFTLLGHSYETHAFEPVTRLCSASICPRPHPSVGKRLRDLGPRFKRSFALFLTSKYHAEIHDWIDPRAQVSRFLASIKPGSGRQLYVLHVLLPHVPWHYLPSGLEYNGTESSHAGLVHGRWAQGHSVDRAYQRHLLQVGYVDLVLGEIVQRLRSKGLWNRSLVVVTADHGISFRPGEQERTVDANNISDVAFVPLFVKLPRQHAGIVDDGAASIIDVVPTIADVLGAKIPWRVDGRSLLSDDRPSPSKIVVLSIFGERVTASWRDLIAERAVTIDRKTELFGSGRDARLLSGLSQRSAGVATGPR